MHKTLRFYSDPAHGWLAVKRKLLEEWGILNKISVYSYQSKTGNTVYLEEDQDARIFMETAKEKGVVIDTKETYYDNYWPGRSYPDFSQ